VKPASYRERDYTFGQRILTLRTAIGLTQAGLADLLKVTRYAVGRWEAQLLVWLQARPTEQLAQVAAEPISLEGYWPHTRVGWAFFGLAQARGEKAAQEWLQEQARLVLTAESHGEDVEGGGDG